MTDLAADLYGNDLPNNADQNTSLASDLYGNIQKDSGTFLGEMSENFKNGISSLRDLVSGNFQDIGNTTPTPKTEALADKVLQGNTDPSILGIAHSAFDNASNISPSDISGSLLEKFSQTAEGKALSALGGINPVWNAAGTAVNRYVNPVISNFTGVAPENLQLLEMGAAPLGLRTASSISDPALATAKYIGKNAASKTAETGKTLATGFNARGAEGLQESSNSLRQSASDLYKKSRDFGAVINQDKVQNIVMNMREAMDESGITDKDFHPQSVAAMNKLKLAADKGDLGLDTLDKYRQLLNNVVSDNTINGKMNSDAYKAKSAISALDDSINGLTDKDVISGDPSAVDALNAGRATWSQYSKFDRVKRIIDQSGGDPNKLKSGFQRFVNNAQNLRGFTPDEISALKDAAASTTGEKILKTLGKFGLDLGSSLSWGNATAPAVELGLGAAGVPGSFPLVGAGTIARQAQKWLARGKVEKALQAIENTKKSQPIVSRFSSEEKSIPETLSLPAPETPMISDVNGITRPMSADERDSAIVRRMESENLGMTPDVRQAQSIHNQPYSGILTDEVLPRQVRPTDKLLSYASPAERTLEEIAGGPPKFADGGSVIDQLARKANINPSEKQKNYGNYEKGHIRIHGLNISIENPKDTYRKGVTKDGKEWKSKMPAHYGYIRGTVAKDGDHVDVFVGPNHLSQRVFIVDQLNPHTGKYDEAKCMLGFPNMAAASKAYHASFSDGKAGKRMGGIVQKSIPEFKEWLERGDTTKPLLKKSA